MARMLAEQKLKGAGNRSVTVNLAESPLSWLAARGRISAASRSTASAEARISLP